jgi:hypothetical protein
MNEQNIRKPARSIGGVIGGEVAKSSGVPGVAALATFYHKVHGKSLSGPLNECTPSRESHDETVRVAAMPASSRPAETTR